MPHLLEARWAVTRVRLDEALQLMQQIRGDAEAKLSYAQYQDALEQNELELALDALEHLSESSSLPAPIWERLAVAAESMDLLERAIACRKMGLNSAR